MQSLVCEADDGDRATPIGTATRERRKAGFNPCVCVPARRVPTGSEIPAAFLRHSCNFASTARTTGSSFTHTRPPTGRFPSLLSKPFQLGDTRLTNTNLTLHFGEDQRPATSPKKTLLRQADCAGGTRYESRAWIVDWDVDRRATLELREHIAHFAKQPPQCREYKTLESRSRLHRRARSPQSSDEQQKG